MIEIHFTQGMREVSFSLNVFIRTCCVFVIGKQKFHIAEATNIYFVIEEDGTEVYLASIKGEMLMWPEESDTWSSVTPSSSATAPLATV